MKRRKFTAETKAKIVLEGLKGRSIAELCIKYEIAQAQYYLWRDQFLKHCPKVFEASGDSRKEEKFQREICRLKTLVGDLTVELKKTTTRTDKETYPGSSGSRQSFA